MPGGRDQGPGPGRGRGRGRGQGRGPAQGRGQTQGRGRGRGRGTQGPSRGGRGPGRGVQDPSRGRGRASPGAASTPYRPPQLSSNPSDLQFIRVALKNCPNHRLKATIEQMEKSWLSCWREVDKLPRDALKILLSTVARLPHSASVSPPPLPACSQVVTTLLGQAKLSVSSGEDLDGNDETLEAVELVERFVTRLLKFTWDLKRDDVKDALDEMIVEADDRLNPRLKMHRPVRGRLTNLLTEMEKEWIIKVRERASTEASRAENVTDWRHPTVSWLTEHKNFQPAFLPKLQLPRSNEGRVYQSSAEYFNTIVRLWIGMTFVEGNNALLPHCSVKVGDKICDQPLWPYLEKNTQPMCRNSNCDRRATFLCAHRMHNKGFCSGCADKLQQRLRGPPSQHASTHIYDGTIFSVKHDGLISIEHFASRRPPLKPIHWRTTKRLSSPNLVGIVMLANREASLRLTDEIFWGEVTFQGKSFDEFKAREQGRLTVRLLEYMDEPGNPMMKHNPVAGGAVAIIDCQTFVPEFIPVLKALETQQHMPVPFEDGALLNLCEDASRVIRERSRSELDEDEMEESDAMVDTRTMPTEILVRTVIRMSLLDPIVDIRRDRGLRDRLEQALVALVGNATLDPGQLKSFAEALMYPVHCTQGPPGTGKSYLGVVVVRALLIVRDLWILKNQEIGEPPILVLSYKNHAIDEFLLDLLRAEPKFDHNPAPYFGKYYYRNSFKKLVRIGGGCSEPELEQYRERNVANNDPTVVSVSKDIERHQNLRDDWHKFRDSFTPIFEAQRSLVGTPESLDAEGRKTVHRAVTALSNAVAVILKLTNSLQPDDQLKVELLDTEDKVEEKASDGISVASNDSDEPLIAIDTLESVDIALKAKPMLTNLDIAKLHAGIKHYDPAIDPREVLYQWISGFHPLPQCNYTVEPCLHVCADGSSLCEEHACKFMLGGEYTCPDAVARKRLFCQRHLCSAETCKNCTIDEKQIYCEDHVCCVCLQRGEVADVALDDPPRNACERYPLCWGLNGMCSDVAEPGSSYCKVHTEELLCKSPSCREIASNGDYCGKHHREMEASRARGSAILLEKCHALTRKGKPCRGKPIGGSGYCRDHISNSKLPAVPTLPGERADEKIVDEPNTSNSSVDVDAKKNTATNMNDDIQAPVPAGPKEGDNHEEAETASTTEQETKSEDDICISDSDDDIFEDAATDVGYANEDEVEESEHLQHLRDVFEVNDDDEDEDNDEEPSEDDDDDVKLTGDISDVKLTLPKDWHWDLMVEERWNAVFSVLELWGSLNSRVKEAFQKKIDALKIMHHDEIVRANARVYEGKAVIGGTITGCVARLEAIRTTNPFAILVEEASEVMEPLLFSCFSSSTRKLEMIGDHMQLQPSVMGRIDFERVNKINISMFERLIRAPHGNEVPSSVLSIQRRMRRNICDLTRNFYTDITTIEDHDICATKVIGTVKGQSRSAFPLLQQCEGGGREVPGVLPHIYFWTHSGAQQRASVGLSRINTVEANMACKLVQYLVHCGVPAKSIAVLTPYKGQLMLMRKMLMDTYGLRMMTKGRDPRPAPQCSVSTVDRFQGDEADIVIISLVIDGKSRTPFVKLQNRMIVLLSRARLGMYIVGNKEYFGETTHWQKTLGLLEQSADSDNAPAVDCTPYNGVRIGPTLPICCPEHREFVVHAKGEKDLKLGFCTVVCSEELACSHDCGLMCHWPKVDDHNKRCKVEVDSPCRLHPRLLSCSTVTTATGEKDIDDALDAYECDFLMEISLPCSHNRRMKCHEYHQIRVGEAPWPTCNKVAIAPFIYSDCKHLLKCSCSEFDRYRKGNAPPCAEKVDFTPRCQHTISLPCHERQEYVSQVRTFVCKTTVTLPLPRCGHERIVACPTAETLDQWSGEPCPTIGLVEEGQSYGSKDYSCKQQVKFLRRCGHHEMVKCERAFELAQTPSRCQETVVIRNPECGHECSVACFEARRIQDKVAQSTLFLAKEVDPLVVVQEGDSSNYRSYGLSIQCSEEVEYLRACGHKVKMKCIDARHTTSVCDALVSTKLPSCGHAVRVPCRLMPYLNAWQPWRTPSGSVQLLHSDNVVEDKLQGPGSRPIELKSILKECTIPVRFRRTRTCGHDSEMTCCDAFKIVEGKETVNPCGIRVLKKLQCGHEAATECSKDIAGVQCQVVVGKPCWNFTTCGHKVEVPCRVSADTIQCDQETNWVCQAGHSFSLRVCSRGIPSDCPICSKDRLETDIKELQRILSDQKLAKWSPQLRLVLPDLEGVDGIKTSPASSREFLVRKLKAFQRFKEGEDPAAEWSNLLFSPMEISVFIVLSRKQQQSFSDRFEFGLFASSKTLNGIAVYEATQDNLTRLAGTGNACVVFGQLYTTKVLVNPTDIPKSTGKKGYDNLRKWLGRQSSHGYDALYRDVKSGKGGSWIVWQPCAMFPTHRVEISDSNRQQILQCLPQTSQPMQSPRKVHFDKPKGLIGAHTGGYHSAPQSSATIPAEESDKLRQLCESVSPLFAKIRLWYPWDGKKLSTGGSEAIPKSIEKSLSSKLNFIQCGAAREKKNAVATPFGGIKYVQSLLTQGMLKDDGKLFLALELLAVRKQDADEARTHLEAYARQVYGDEASCLHPLVVVAIARLSARSSPSQPSDVQRKLLEIFAKLYPEAKDLWLDEGESNLAQPAIVASRGVSAGASGSLTVEEKWEALKEQYGCKSEAMEDLLKLVGLNKVKQEAVRMFRNAMTLQQMSTSQRKKNMLTFNYCFVGNPGTGKTTVARLFGTVMNESNIRRANSFVECSAQKLKDDGADEFRKLISNAMGGVLFIDEAYELDPAGDFKGKPIMAELLTAAENKREDLSIILAGYEDDIQKKLYAYNDGMSSRFTEVMFEDFDAQDLEVIWDGMAQDRGWKYEQAIAKVVCRRLAKAAGRKGFGNARAVRKLFEQASKAALARDDFDPTDLKFETVDLLGERPSTNPKLRAVLAEVEEKTGWRKIKDELRKLVRISDENYEREMKGQETVPLCLNRLFLGNPGTGKTTCAAFYGRVLKALHFLGNGEVVKKTAGDFIGSHVGESQTKTSQLLEMAKGKVLVIDEAYNLNDNMYGKQVLDVLVEKVQGTESDDIAVLLIGYENEMLEMLRTQNPGLMRRFPPQFAFNFEDYTEHELLDILEWNCAKRNVTCPYDVAEALLKQLALQKTQPNFGNAGAVEQLLKNAMGKAVSRPLVAGKTVLTLADVGVGADSDEKRDPLQLLDKLYRMDDIREQLIRLRNEMAVADREGSALPEVGHFVFRGSPGTGKTTVARAMAQILHDMGVLATTKLVETSGLDLTAEYVGQTKKNVTDKLGEAKGGLLFIDEAYELGKGTYGEEAMTTLVAAMTDPSYKGMVIIIAGYRKDIDQMLDRNAGLKSRFTRFIDFADWEAQDAVMFLSSKAENEDFEMDGEAVESLQRTFVQLKKLDNFSNGRDAMSLWKEILQCRAQRVFEEPEDERTITGADADNAGESVLIARRGSGLGRKGPADENPLQLLDDLYRMDKIREQLGRLQTEMAVAESEGSERPEIGHFVFRGSPGTGKTTVARVMAQILYAMGALATTKLVETSGLDLTGEYLGQTKQKVTDKLVEAKGGLLFIDEAYELGKGMYGEEAMTTLVAAMTDPVYAGMVIVIAGYPADMNAMLDRNAGLKSRFTRFINFPDWEAEDGVAFLQKQAGKEEISLQPDVEQVLHQTFVQLKELDGFGNGRDAVRVWKEMKQSRAQRVFKAPEMTRTMTKQDAEIASESVLEARRPPDGLMLSQSSLSRDTSTYMTQQKQPRQQERLGDTTQSQGPVEVLIQQQEETREATVVATEEVETEFEHEDTGGKVTKVQRDPGVSDEDWEELQLAVAAHEEHLESIRRAREEARLEEERRLAELERAKEFARLEEEKRRIAEQRAREQAQLEEEKRRAQAIQEKIRRICPCPMGFNWTKVGSGWRCGGGSHYVSDAQLNSQFTC